MKNVLVLTLLGGLVVGIAVAATLGVFRSDSATAGYAAPDASLEARIEALEQALGEERDARQLLEDELFALINEWDEALVEGNAAARSGTSANAAPDLALQVQNRERNREARDPQSRSEQLQDRGYAPDEADLIARREAELRMQSMQARWEARQNGESLSFTDPAFNPDLALRNELGDAEYERYLEANGRPTSFTVREVIDYSPASEAGFQSGDQILSYNGERVFGVLDLNRLQAQTSEASSVVIEVERDGQTIQLTVPPGPIGVSVRPVRRR